MRLITLYKHEHTLPTTLHSVFYLKKINKMYLTDLSKVSFAHTIVLGKYYAHSGLTIEKVYI